jgi:light-regulated signal transduction histidine kinase (bacteriophytochrome)
MNNLITDLLAYSRISDSEVSPTVETSSQVALQETLWNLRAAIDDSGATVTHGDLPSVPFEGQQLSQLFLNLIGNSIKYRRKDELPRIHVSAELGMNEWTFSVSDNGIGFEHAETERIFLPFKRLQGREYEGTGIGLAICKRIVERRSGQIWASSESGVGSTFRFTVPKVISI